MQSQDKFNSAEERFREAFDRLKSNSPRVLNQGTAVSQNNVAREAGCDPSALRKSRFPSLIREIQAYVEIHKAQETSARQQIVKQRLARVDFRRRIEEVSNQRDYAQSQLASAQRAVLELLQENAMLRAHIAELNPAPHQLLSINT